MSAIELERVSKQWINQFAVNDLTLVIPAEQFTVLLGPSGCGKSTTLRMIAGLEEPSAGLIRIAGRDMRDVEPARRNLSMVFQSYALFPHLNVRENILFGLKVRRLPRTEQRQRLQRIVRMVGLDGLLERRPAQLSGGQRQRVALARALIAEYPICLMDEPLSNLDAKLRQEMRVELKDLQQQLNLTVVYVTHDQIEAMSMADQVVLMNNGRIEQRAAPKQIYARPQSEFAARFIGTPPMNVLAVERDPQCAWIAGDAHRSPLASPHDGASLGVRAEDIDLAAADQGVAGTVGALDYHGADTMVQVKIGTQSLAARTAGHFDGQVGDRIGCRWPAHKTHWFDANGQRIDYESLQDV